MVCLGILWNSMDEFVDEVLKDINKYAKVLDCYTLKLGDNYETFVRDIYNQDDIAEWKVDKKIETMFSCSDIRNVNIVLMNIKTDKQEFHPLKKRMVYTNLEQMKVDIREKYSKLVKVYFFDNIFHVTDDEKEFDADYNIVKKYMNRECIKPKSMILKKENKNEFKPKN